MDKIVLQNVRKEYKISDEISQCALKDINLILNSNELVVLLGPSGSGKSTLLNLIGGIDVVTSGKILVDGKEVSNFNKKQLCDYRADYIGFVFQFYNLIPNLTVFENVKISTDITRNESFDPDDLIEQVGLSQHKSKFPNQLSGGEQQRISIARALVKKSDIILCDEPTGALDSQIGKKILELLIENQKKFQNTMIIVTHNSAFAKIADRVVHIKDGEITRIEKNENKVGVEDIAW